MGFIISFGIALLLGIGWIYGIVRIKEEEDKQERKHRRERIKAEAKGYRRGFADGRTY